MRRLVGAVVAAASVASASGAPPGAPGGPAPAGASGSVAPQHRAAVIVDTGTQVKSVCVRFNEESITGIEALQRAAVDPVVRAFPGKGAAVCALCGTGCPADESCLTCDPDGRFWSYSRAAGGTPSFRLSGAGASNTTVRDGDVEGWRWGHGGSPAFASVQQVCGEVEPAATSTTPAPTAAPTTASLAPAPTTMTTMARALVKAPAGRLPAAVSTTAAPPPPAGAAAPSPTVSEKAPTTPPTTGAPSRLAAPTSAGGEDGAGWGGLAGFAAVLCGLLAWATLTRRRRRPPP